MNAHQREQLVGQLAARGWLRLVQEAIAEATESYWLRRAADFSAVGTPACDEVAIACRRRASLAELTEHDAIEALRDFLADLEPAA